MSKSPEACEKGECEARARLFSLVRTPGYADRYAKGPSKEEEKVQEK